MRVPIFDLSRVFNPFRNHFHASLDRCLDNNNFILGEEVKSFEEEFSEKSDSKYCVGMSSGTDALLAMFMALDLAPGDEIIVPSFTFVSSASAIIRAGLKPVFADLGEDSFHIDLDTIKRSCGEKTKGVLFVHLFGEYVDISDISDFCKKEKIFLLEDCAQSFGKNNIGYGEAQVYSFFPAKNLGCLGDGGCITVGSYDFYEKLKMIRTHGSRKKYHYEILGGNFRLDALQASFLRTLLAQSDVWIDKRCDNASYYIDSLQNISSIEVPSSSLNHSWNQFTLRVDDRDGLKSHLDKNGIQSAIYYPMPLHHSGTIFESKSPMPETEQRCKEVLSIPIYPGLLEKEREYVVKKIKEYLK